MLGADWNLVLPTWFSCLAATSEPDEFAEQVLRTVHDLIGDGGGRYLKHARKGASSAQKRALRGRSRV